MADSLPVALAASLLVLAAIAGLAGLGLSRASPLVSSASVDGQLSTLVNDGQALLASAPRDLADPASPPGATKKITLSLPPGTRVTFGPGGAIVYEVSGSRKALALDGVRLRRGIDRGGIMVPSTEGRAFESGRYELTIEYEYDRSLDEKYLVFY